MTPEKTLQKAQQALQKGKPKEAVAVLEKALVANPKNMELRLLLASIYNDLRQPALALTNLEPLQEEHGDNPAVHCQLGIAYKQSQNLPLAREHLRKAVELTPNDANPWIHLCHVYLSEGRTELALQAVDKTLDLQPNQPQHMLAKSSILEMLHRLDEAKTLAERVLKKNPKYALALSQLGKIQRRQGEIEEALASYKKAAEYHTDPYAKGDTLNAIGMILDKQEDYNQAFKYFVKGQKMMRDSVQGKAYPKEQYLQVVELYSDWMQKRNHNAPVTRTANDDLPTPIFMVGFPRSGTTLTEQMLISHPDIHTTQEKPVISVLIGNIPKFLGRKIHYPYDLDKLSAEDIHKLRQGYWQCYEMLVHEKPRSNVIDKLPLNVVALGLIHTIFPEANIIMSLRDPRDSVLSCFIQAFQPNPGMANFYTIDDAARFYRRVMNLYQQYREHLPLKLHELRYEDLISDPETRMKALVAFLGLSWSDKVLSYHDKHQLRYINTPSYEAVTKGVYKSAQGRWKHYATHMEPALSILQPFVKAFGYPVK